MDGNRTATLPAEHWRMVLNALGQHTPTNPIEAARLMNIRRDLAQQVNGPADPRYVPCPHSILGGINCFDCKTADMAGR